MHDAPENHTHEYMTTSIHMNGLTDVTVTVVLVVCKYATTSSNSTWHVWLQSLKIVKDRHLH
jgi:hypothetical protein